MRGETNVALAAFDRIRIARSSEIDERFLPILAQHVLSTTLVMSRLPIQVNPRAFRVPCFSLRSFRALAAITGHRTASTGLKAAVTG